MDDLKVYTDFHVAQLKQADRDDAYFSLIEADHEIVAHLIAAFRKEQSPTVRATLVEIIWQHRLPETLSFLVEALEDPAMPVFRSALNGFVTLGGSAATILLECARQRFCQQDKLERVEWVEEAIQHLAMEDTQ
ncbi:MAG: HEAT repeat domain-containing protein [Chloroflexi bacterium]|nr:HEAT repeat domain-containing protein [Chloroflexota bacterium]